MHAPLCAQWMRGKDGFLLVFSLDDLSSLDALEPYAHLHFLLHGYAQQAFAKSIHLANLLNFLVFRVVANVLSHKR